MVFNSTAAANNNTAAIILHDHTIVFMLNEDFDISAVTVVTENCEMGTLREEACFCELLL
jgi:hypothetical protein